MSNGDQSDNHVTIGSGVKVLLNGVSEKVFTVITSGDVAPERGIISEACPVGKALVGAKKGDHVSYQLNGNTYTVEILEVIPPEE